MSLTQLAAASGMGASKVHRYLVSLGRAGLVMQSRSSGLYDMGPSLRRLGMEALRRMDEVGLASEHLPGLRDRTGHAVNLAVWGDHGPVIVRWDYGSYALPITVRVGATLPMLSSSVGRVYLAHLPETLTGPVLRGERESGTRADVPARRDRQDQGDGAARRRGAHLRRGDPRGHVSGGAGFHGAGRSRWSWPSRCRPGRRRRRCWPRSPQSCARPPRRCRPNWATRRHAALEPIGRSPEWPLLISYPYPRVTAVRRPLIVPSPRDSPATSRRFGAPPNRSSPRP